MQSIDQIFERATIKGIVDYLLFGIGPNADNRSYEERLEEPYVRFEKEVEKHDPSPSSKLLDLSNELTSETAANSHFLRTAGPHFPDSPGHIKRTAWDISRAEGTPPH